jgi:hypothetical protein
MTIIRGIIKMTTVEKTAQIEQIKKMIYYPKVN